MIGVLIRRERFGNQLTERIPCDKRGREEETDATLGQEMPKNGGFF